jgi:hypothetical protein
VRIFVCAREIGFHEVLHAREGLSLCQRRCARELNLCSKACPRVVLYSRGPMFEKYSFFSPTLVYGGVTAHCLRGKKERVLLCGHNNCARQYLLVKTLLGSQDLRVERWDLKRQMLCLTLPCVQAMSRCIDGL